jgi:hypothetical protein
MKPMIEAIKSKNPYKMAQFEDLRKMELSDVTTPKKEKPTQSSVKITKVEQEVNQNHSSKTTIVPEKQKVKTVADYEEGDLRSLLKQASKSERSAYQLLLENGFIDDMSFWEEGVVK